MLDKRLGSAEDADFGQWFFKIPLSQYTTWKIGGLTDALFLPNGILNLSKCLNKYQETPFQILGLGSNVLVRDGGFRGIVVLSHPGMALIKIQDEEHIYAEAGVPCAKFSRFCARLGLEGAEFFAGIPGTIGGALRMNAGCDGAETWDYVSKVETMNRKGEISERQPNNFHIGYRTVEHLGDSWFISAVFRFKKGSKEKSFDKIKKLLARRAATQPTGEASCGSVFKNPPGDFAARLIEAAGLKGYRIGGASISKIHTNFIINENCAKSYHIEQLIETIQQVVKSKFNILLQQEVITIGEN